MRQLESTKRSESAIRQSLPPKPRRWVSTVNWSVRESRDWFESGTPTSGIQLKPESASRVILWATAARGGGSVFEDTAKERVSALRTRWEAYLDDLALRGERGQVSVFQASFVRRTWLKIIALLPNIMYPTAGSTEDGDLYMTWNQSDLTMTLEVHKNSASWFLADEGTGHFDGSEEDIDELPPRVLTLLRLFQR